MTHTPSQQSRAFSYALKQAYDALRQGNTRAARRWAQQAAALGPEREEAWLILASVANPKASVHYLEQALSINPESDRARKGMRWAVQRLRASEEQPPTRFEEPELDDTAETVVQEIEESRAAVVETEAATAALLQETAPRPEIRTRIRPEDRLRRRSVLVPLISAATFVCLIAAAWFSSPMLVQALASPQFASVAIAGLQDPTATTLPDERALPSETSTPEPTETALPSVTPLPSLTPLPTNTPTPTPTNTPTPLPTDTPVPTPVPTQVPTQPPPSVNLPEGVGANENWIDIDLSEQILRAYTGETLVRTFVVSTGTWQTPTVLGTYKVYVKYTYADMSGPGYYLANVPFVMYFYQGYGIHGTYWHNNFGTPMSHGCINMTIDDAGWMFDFSVVGTVVNVHN